MEREGEKSLGLTPQSPRGFPFFFNLSNLRLRPAMRAITTASENEARQSQALSYTPKRPFLNADQVRCGLCAG